MFETKFSYTSEKFGTEFEAGSESFSTEFGNLVNIGQSFPKYVGEYTVTPLVDQEQTLATANKLMVQDIVVKKIPFSETSNTAGGTTVFIGKELE